ncbi:MAG TPA: hypothetical protein VM864_05875 [Pyrinomonadaceae bacterium]|nr:hypothetical protein [Pyrinomonadaceae bacterium]
MNCQDFESVAFELARAQLLDAAARESATAHAGSCELCAGRLRRERALTEALREVGAGTREACAPPRVEAALLAAFRERRAAAPAATAGAVGATRAGSWLAFTLRTRAVRRGLASAAVAASLVVALAAAWRALTPKTPGDQLQGVAQVSKEQSPSGKDDPSPQRGEQHAAAMIEVKGGQAPPVATRAARRAPRRRADAVEHLPIAFRMDGGEVVSGEGESAAATATSQAADAAGAADFVQLATGDSSAPLESGQMVRVQVPRAALAALGVPVNAERAGELVKADILLAHDGTARAIRLRP